MSRVTIDLDDDLVQVLELLEQPVEQAVRETIVLELYRRAIISSGKAAELLAMSTQEFIQLSGRLGIPYFRMSEAEWEKEIAQIRSI